MYHEVVPICYLYRSSIVRRGYRGAAARCRGMFRRFSLCELSMHVSPSPTFGLQGCIVLVKPAVAAAGLPRAALFGSSVQIGYT